MFAGLFSGKKLSGRERRLSPRMPLRTTGQLVICPASPRTAPITVHVSDCSATGVGVIHTDPLPLGQKFVVKEQTISRQKSVLFTVVRSDRIDENRFSIGLHASHLLENAFEHSQRRAPQQNVATAALILLTLGAGAAALIFLYR